MGATSSLFEKGGRRAHADLRLLVRQSVEAIAVADLNGNGKPGLVAVVSNTPLAQNDISVYLIAVRLGFAPL